MRRLTGLTTGSAFSMRGATGRSLLLATRHVTPLDRAVRRRIVVMLGALVLGAIDSRADVGCFEQPAPLTCPGPANNNNYVYLLALPTGSPIDDASSLKLVTRALAVAKFNKATEHWLLYDGTCKDCPSGSPLLGLSTGCPGSAGEGANCFAVGPSDGLAVLTREPGRFQLEGTDAAILNTLHGPGVESLIGNNFFSQPFCPAAPMTAKQLMDDIGFQSVASVGRYVAFSDSFFIYTGRTPQPASANFSLVAGTAYIVKMKTTTTYTPAVAGNCSFGSCDTQTPPPQIFGIDGSINSDTFAFSIKDANGATVCFNNCATLTNPGTNVDAAANFVAAINASCPAGVQASQVGTTNHFGVALEPFFKPPLKLNVKNGPGELVGCGNVCPTVNCAVTGATVDTSCTFNPTVFLDQSNVVAVPTMPTWAAVALGGLLLGAAGLLLRRYWS